MDFGFFGLSPMQVYAGFVILEFKTDEIGGGKIVGEQGRKRESGYGCQFGLFN